MKACIMQPFYSLDYSRSRELLQWQLDALDKCDDSMDLILLPEYADVPALAPDRESHFASTAQYTQLLLDKCRETARRCDAVVFVNACGGTADSPRNTTYAFDRQGREAGRYDKRHLVSRERDKLKLDSSYADMFTEPTVVTVDGVRYGFLTCYDFYFYESYPVLARQNVDVIIGCSHQRSDTLQATELICRFCAYHTNAYVLRASVCLEPGGNVGGGSMIVSPFGEVLANMENRVGMTCAEFDPHQKYLKPAGFGNPPAPHHAYIDQGRRPWQYRPAGSAICLTDGWMPYPRICAWEGSMMTLGGAVAEDAPEIGFELMPREDGTFCTGSGVDFQRILRKFSCHAVFAIRLRGVWEESLLRHLAEQIYLYDCTKYTYIISDSPDVLKILRKTAPWMSLCLAGTPEQASVLGCRKVLAEYAHCEEEWVMKAHALDLRCCVAGVQSREEARRCLAWGADTLITPDYSLVTGLE